MTWSDATAAVESYRGLADDWDGGGSPGIPDEIIEAAKIVLCQIRREGFVPPDRIAPGVNGNIWLEWFPGGGTYAEVEVAMPPENLFVIKATHPIGDGWEDREAAIYHAVGRRADHAGRGSGVSELWYYCDSFTVAREIRDAILKVGGVSCVAREPIDGR